MGANSTQAGALLLFLLAFTLIAVGLAADINYIAVVAGLALLAGSTMLFQKCKPWEHNEQ
jgi:hypothetical protein